MDGDDWRTADIFSYGKHFLPMNYLELLAVKMTANGQHKYAHCDQRKYYGWVVTVEDVLQWIGVWMYMLAFPQQSSARRSFFTPPTNGFGPIHNISQILARGGRGERGGAWFEMMQACFELPQWSNGTETQKETGGDVYRSAKFTHDDPFKRSRRWWDSLRAAFHHAVIPAWLLTADESMVRWLGHGMPGLMVVLRKPTPIGLEIHTLCCSLSGILVWFEVYGRQRGNGKEALQRRAPKEHSPHTAYAPTLLCFGAQLCPLPRHPCLTLIPPQNSVPF